MEPLGLSYEEAEKLLTDYIKDPITRMHSWESEAIMRALARYFHENETDWGILGLLHDIDWELTKNDVTQHCVKCGEILRTAGATDYCIQTIQSHGYGQVHEFSGKNRESRIQHALAAAETLTGLIIASALVQPDKKLASVKIDSLKKKFNNLKFAAGCNRQIILECEKIGIPIDEFLDISLKAIQGIHEKLGL